MLLGGNGPEPRLNKLLAQGCKCPVVFDDGRGSFAELLPGLRSALHRNPGPSTGWAVSAGLSLRTLCQRRMPSRAGTAFEARREAA